MAPMLKPEVRPKLDRALELLAELEGRLGAESSAEVHRILGELRADLDDLQTDVDTQETVVGVFDAIVRQRSPEHGLVAALHFLVERLGVDASGLRLREGDDFPYFVTTGFSKDFVLAENHLCVRGLNGRARANGDGEPVLECMCGAVIRGRTDPTMPFFTTGGSFWTNSTSELLETTTDEEFGTTPRGRCNRDGYESVALIPLRSEEGTFGLLQFNDHRAGRFNKHTVLLLEELSTYLARLLV